MHRHIFLPASGATSDQTILLVKCLNAGTESWTWRSHASCFLMRQRRAQRTSMFQIPASRKLQKRGGALNIPSLKHCHSAYTCTIYMGCEAKQSPICESTFATNFHCEPSERSAVYIRFSCSLPSAWLRRAKFSYCNILL